MWRRWKRCSEKLLKPNSRRNALDRAMKTKGHNQRRACALAGIDPREYRRRPKHPADTELRAMMKELASERRWLAYRRLHILLKREVWEVNWKKLNRLYREEALTVRKRGGSQARSRDAGAYRDPARPEQVLVARIHVRCVGRLSSVPRTECHRRLQP